MVRLFCLVVVRVGAEGSVTADGHAYLLERQASDLVQQVLASTSRALTGYKDVPHAARWAAELDTGLARLAAAAEAARRAELDLRAARRAAGGPLQERVDSLTADLTGHERAAARARELTVRWSARRDRAAARTTLPVLGRLFEILRRRHDQRIKPRTFDLAWSSSPPGYARPSCGHNLIGAVDLVRRPAAALLVPGRGRT